MNPPAQKKELMTQLAKQLAIEVLSIVHQFESDHPYDQMYAFALMATAEGTWIGVAIATEQTLETVAQSYLQKGYQATTGNTLALLHLGLRWANPDDGWYYYDLPEPSSFLEQLQAAFDAHAIEYFDGSTVNICLAALQQLDGNHTFGTGIVRENITLSFTYGEDPRDFVTFAEQLNPTAQIKRVRQEQEAGDTAWDQLQSPFRKF